MESRIAALEEQLEAMKRRQARYRSICVACVGLILIVFVSGQSQTTTAPTPHSNVQDTVIAKRIVVVDDAGKQRVVIGDEIAIYDEMNSPRIRFATKATKHYRSASIELSGVNNHGEDTRLVLNADESGAHVNLDSAWRDDKGRTFANKIEMSSAPWCKLNLESHQSKPKAWHVPEQVSITAGLDVARSRKGEGTLGGGGMICCRNAMGNDWIQIQCDDDGNSIDFLSLNHRSTLLASFGNETIGDGPVGSDTKYTRPTLKILNEDGTEAWKAP